MRKGSERERDGCITCTESLVRDFQCIIIIINTITKLEKTYI